MRDMKNCVIEFNEEKKWETKKSKKKRGNKVRMIWSFFYV